jgi:hypothetical protein
MNELLSVTDLTWESILGTQYDLAIVACGHETRCRYVASRFERSRPSRLEVLGFSGFREESTRVLNDEYFTDHWNVQPIITQNRDDNTIFGILDAAAEKDQLRSILVDYSSMTRFWYTAVLNWFRYRWDGQAIDLDFVYAPGHYEGNIPRLEVEEIVCLPGCEGSTSSSGPSIALVGMGFDGLSALCALDDLEPDLVIGFAASDGAESEYVEIVRKENAEMLDRSGKELLIFPMQSLVSTVRLLSEVISPYRHGFSVTIVPMGPKPHVLASVLLAMRLPQIACLHVSGTREYAWDAKPDGRVFGTRVRFRRHAR